MENYLLTFDAEKDAGYKAVLSELEKLEAVSVLRGVWHLRYSNTNAAKLLAYFQRLIGKKDTLLVVKISDWAGVNLTTDLKNS